MDAWGCDISLVLDIRYTGLLASQLRNFHSRGNYSYNFSCPICGDSHNNKYKARGYIYRYGTSDHLQFHCFNHGGGDLRFSTFLKTVDPGLHQEYAVEEFVEKHGSRKTEAQIEYTPKPMDLRPKVEELDAPHILRSLPSVASLPATHIAHAYLIKRKIPSDFLVNLYYTEDFAALAEQISPGQRLRGPDPRIVIPMLDEDLRLLAVQGRSLPSARAGDLRYITVKTHPDNLKVFGLDRINKQKRIYVCEGVFDSMFLPNCVAVTGADIPNSLPPDKALVVYDNERRNHQIVEHMLKVASRGYRVTLWPDTIEEKDINDMIIAGHTRKKIREIIDCNSYKGVEAHFRIQRWRRDQ